MDNLAGRWGGRPSSVTLDRMDWTWKVGALRPGAENIDWTDTGARPDWPSARTDTIRALRALVAREGRQEYRFTVGDLEGMVHPGLTPSGAVDLNGLGDSLPIDWS